MRRTPFAPLLALLAVLLPAAPGSARIVELTVVHTNDIHGGINPSDATYMNRDFPPKLGGGASMVTLLRRLRAEAEAKGNDFLLVDSGDIFQGTPIGTITQGRAVVDFMNAAGYDAFALGNHDFDEGLANCQDLVERAHFPALAANLETAGTGEVVDWVEPWVIKDFGDLRVGIFGLITPETLNMSFPANVEGLDFAPMAPAARRAVAELNEQGVDLVLGIGHVGIPYDPQEALEQRRTSGWPEEDDPRSTAIDVARSAPGIDAFFAGHIHKGFDEAYSDAVNHTLIFQTYGRGSGAGIVTISVDTDTNQIVGYRFRSERGYLITFFEDEFWPDPDVARAIDEEVAKAERGMDEVLGQTTDKFSRGGDGETPMGNAVCDAMLEEVEADFSFTNLGGIRDEFGPGPITPRDVFQVLPFGNKMIVFRMTGAMLLNVIETRVSQNHGGLYIAGGDVVYNKTRPDFDRVTHLTVGGQPWSPDATYRVVTSDFLAKGNADLTMLPAVPEDQKTYTGKTMREALQNWIRRHSPASPVLDGRWVRDDEAEPTPAFSAAKRGVDAP
jgi:2',3'-cyclic-nucleotide 2'-phosphodiesterase (5'-nucleotidase family)